MEIKVIEKSNNKLKIEIRGESHTLLNLLRKNLWALDVEQAAYMIEHPYLSEPEIIVKSKNPLKSLHDATQLIIDQSKEFEKEFKRALSK